MNEDSILDEVYAARKELWKEAGETLAGLGAFLRDHPVPGVKYAKLKTAKPKRMRRLGPHARRNTVTAR